MKFYVTLICIGETFIEIQFERVRCKIARARKPRRSLSKRNETKRKGADRKVQSARGVLIRISLPAHCSINVIIFAPQVPSAEATAGCRKKFTARGS